MQKDSASETKDYVVLIHGIGHSCHSFLLMEKFFKKEGYEVINIDYPSRKDTIENLVKKYIAKEIKERCPDKKRKINFVTHSMGGIVLRYFLTKNKLKNLGRIVMLVPPNHGSKAADKYGKISAANKIMGPALKQMCTDKNSFVNKLPVPKCEFGIIAGKYDKKVSIKEASLTGMSDFLLMPYGHTIIMNVRPVMEAALNFLESGKFKIARL